jgi:hypothetical protein
VPRRIVIAVVATLVAALACSPFAAAAVTQSVDFNVKTVRSDRKQFRGGLTLRTVLRIGESTGAKPPPLTHTTLRFPKGAVLNARLFKKCSRTALERRGPAACPKGSKIGRGTSLADARPILPSVSAKITMFNGRLVGGDPTILIYAVPEISSPLTLEARLHQNRRSRYGYVLELDVPPIPTLPGQPNASVTFFDATTLDRTVRRKGRRRHYIEGPIICSGTFLMLDGALSYEGIPPTTVLERFTLTGGPRCP